MSNVTENSKGKALITGASSGLGAVYAERLAARGYDVLLVARRADRLETLAQTIRERYGVGAETLTADLTDSADLEKVAGIAENDAAITLLVNNAGIPGSIPSAKMPFAEANKIIDLNVTALTRLSLAVLPRFIERNQGTLINIGSVLSFFVTPTVSAQYSASKAYVSLFTHGLQQEVAGTDVRIQLVLPAATATEIWDVAGVGVSALDPAIVMSTEDCVDASLAGLDQGELVTLPSMEDASLWNEYDVLRGRMAQGVLANKPASRYGVGVVK